MCAQSTLGVVLRLLEDRRGDQVELSYLDKERVMLRYLLPWQEVRPFAKLRAICVLELDIRGMGFA